ncbi:MAG: hypothetical protein WA395_13895 [Nitrososphaeraceae archaeon]
MKKFVIPINDPTNAADITNSTNIVFMDIIISRSYYKKTYFIKETVGKMIRKQLIQNQRIRECLGKNCKKRKRN